jgi:hypothetical protein
MSLNFFQWGYVMGIVYRTPVTSPVELKLRTVAVIETVTPQMLEKTWRETLISLGHLMCHERRTC